MQAEEFDPFLDEMFQNSDDNNLMEEADTFLKSLQTKLDEQEGIYSEFKQKHLKWYNNFNIFQKEYSKFNEEVSKNLKKIQENKDILNSRLNLSSFVEKFFKNRKDFQVPDWFIKNFFAEENAKFKESLTLFMEKMMKARFTEEFCTTRQKLSDDINGQIEKVLNIFVDENNIDSFYLLSIKDIIKGIAEIKLYDQMVQDFIWQMIKRTIDYLNNVILDFRTFKENSKTSLNKIKEIKFEGDESFLIQLNNIHKRTPDEIRIKRYEISLSNQNLASLQQGKCLDRKIALFFVEYLKERNSKIDNDKYNKIYVNHADFFEKLMPVNLELDYNMINYNAIKSNTDRHNGKNHTIFHSFDKILFLIMLNQDNLLIVEINNKNNKEIIIYDSNYGFTGNTHQKIIEVIRAYMVEELKNKGEIDEEESLLFEREYAGRSAWCPQVANEIDKGLFTVMNYKYLSEGADLSSKFYSLEDMMKFRVDLFSLLMRIGFSKETILNFELLL